MGSGQDGVSFYGDARVFDDNPVTRFVDLPSGVWTIAAIPKGGWHVMLQPANGGRGWSSRSAGILVVAPACLAGRLVEERRAHFDRLADRERQLEQLSRRLESPWTPRRSAFGTSISTPQELVWDDRMNELYGYPPTPVRANIGIGATGSTGRGRARRGRIRDGDPHARAATNSQYRLISATAQRGSFARSARFYTAPDLSSNIVGRQLGRHCRRQA